MKTHQNELLVYYDPKSTVAKKVLAYAKSVSTHVKEVEYHKNPFTPTLMRSILKSLNMEAKELLNKADPYYQANIRGRDFDAEGWLNILIKNPDLIKAPIAVHGQKVVLCTNAMDVYRLQ